MLEELTPGQPSERQHLRERERSVDLLFSQVIREPAGMHAQ